MPYRVALAFHGKLGGWDKATPGATTTDEVFNLSVTCWQENVLQRVAPGVKLTVFLHSWEVRWEGRLRAALRPTRLRIEPQIMFRPPSQLATRSFWYGRRAAVQLARDYEEEHNWAFDLVHTARLDSCACSPLGYGPHLLPPPVELAGPGDVTYVGPKVAGEPRAVTWAGKHGTTFLKGAMSASDFFLMGKSTAIIRMGTWILENLGTERARCPTICSDNHKVLGAAWKHLYNLSTWSVDARVMLSPWLQAATLQTRRAMPMCRGLTDPSAARACALTYGLANAKCSVLGSGRRELQGSSVAALRSYFNITGQAPPVQL